jgi:uncharacterized membrane protein
MAFCANCGAQMAENAAFCPSCGQPVGQANPAAAVPPPGSTYHGPEAAAMPMEENVAGMLAYFTIVPAIVFLLIAPFNSNRFVRFHCFQCIFAAVALIVADIALMIVSSIFHLIPVLGWFVTALMWPLYGLAVFALWLLLVIKAYQHQIYKLPVIGDIAERQAGA